MAIEVIRLDKDNIFIRLKRTWRGRWRVTQGDGSVWLADFSGRNDAIMFIDARVGQTEPEDKPGRATTFPRR